MKLSITPPRFSIGVMLVILLFACSNLISHTAYSAEIIVYVFNNEFSVNPPGDPVENAVITAGDTVTWLWVQGGHTTTSVAGSTEVWNEVIDQNNTSFSYIFNNVGVFWYYCIPHGNDDGDGTSSGMSGTITVLEAGVGACCLYDGTCYDTTAADCYNQGGNFQGAGTACATSSCTSNLDLQANSDNTIYELTPEVSNGLGQHIWVGDNNQNDHRRGLINFDLSAIPSDAIIVDAQVSLYCNDAAGGAVPMSLHTVSTLWGEGTSDANGQETSGASATPGDATWLYANFNTDLWSTPGGDFNPAASASTSVDGADLWYTWTDPQLASDVQLGLLDPASFSGWIMIGEEATSGQEKRFFSKDNGDPAFAPVLTISYLIAPTGACCMPDATCFQSTEIGCTLAGGTYNGDLTTCLDVYCSPQLTPFIDPLPLPAVAQPVTGTAGTTAYYELSMTEQMQQLHSELPMTRVWGYDGSYPGPTIEAFRKDTVTVLWTNDLRYVENNQLRTDHALWVDTCLHGPDHTLQSPVAIVHLHGGVVAPESDGNPDWAFPPGVTAPLYTYPNDQPASTIWYHDHALGITRLNVMMGMAGFYIIRDTVEQALNLPDGEFEIPLAIQDRQFNADGSIRYPEVWDEHFFGDKILVNGKVWPYLDVKKGKYRFRLLNGSNSRTYKLSLSDGAPFWMIATDLGLRDVPLELTELVLTPGERAEIIVDFENYATGTEIILTNSAPAPYPGFGTVGVIPDIMKFIVTDQPGDTDPIPGVLADVPLTPEAEAVLEREFDLVKMPPIDCGNHQHGMWSINGLMWDDITEFPVLGTTEIWTWINTSGMTHPMHMHLVKFQILDRTPIDANGNPTGPAEAPEDFEIGWKDTVNSLPGYRTRVIAKFEGYTGLYPYHCHILEHEDHEMMRQFMVLPPTVTGCVDPAACNYESTATSDDGSCYYNCLACTTDLNNDGEVNTSDMLLFLAAFGCAPPDDCSGADFNDDGETNVQDLLLFLAGFGGTCDAP